MKSTVLIRAFLLDTLSQMIILDSGQVVFNWGFKMRVCLSPPTHIFIPRNQFSSQPANNPKDINFIDKQVFEKK